MIELTQPANSTMVRAEFSPDGDYLVSALSNGQFLITNIDGSIPNNRIIGKLSERPSAFSIHPSGTEAVIDCNGQLEVWDLVEAKKLRVLISAEIDESIQSIKISTDGEYLAFATNYELLYLVDYSTGSIISKIDGGERNGSIFFSSDNLLLGQAFSYPGSSYVCFYQILKTDELIAVESEVKTNYDTIVGGTFSSDAKSFCFCDINLNYYASETKSLLWSTPLNPDTNKRADYLDEYPSNPIILDDKEVVICGTSNGDIKIFKISDGTLLKTINLNQGAVLSLDYSHKKELLVSVGSNQKAVLIPIENLELG